MANVFPLRLSTSLHPQVLYQATDEGAVIFVGANRRKDKRSIAEDAPHYLYLPVLLLEVVLVDTDRVYPDPKLCIVQL